MRYDIDCSVTDVERLSSQISDADSVINEVYDPSSGGKLEEIMNIFRDNLVELRAEASDSYYVISNDISDANRAKDINYAKINELKLQISECRKTMDELSSKISALGDRMSSLSAKRALITGDSESANSSRAAIDSAIANCQRQINNLEGKKEDMRRIIRQCEADIRRIEDMIYNLDCIIDSANSARSAIDAHVSKCETLVANIESMLENVRAVYASYRQAYSNVASKTAEAKSILDSLNSRFFELTNSTVLDSDRIQVVSSDYFRNMAKSFTVAKEQFRSTGMRLFDSTAELNSIISDDVIRDAAVYLAELNSYINDTADDFSKKGEKFRSCATLVDHYTALK